MMQPCMWTSYLFETEPRRMVQLFAKHGWSALEMSDEHGHDLLKLGDPLKVGQEFRRYAADYGVSFPQGHFILCTKGIRRDDLQGRCMADIAPADQKAFEVSMDAMHRWVDLFNGLGIKAGVLHAGGQTLRAAGWPDDRILARRVEAIRRVAEYAKGGPTWICLENLPLDSSGVATAAELIELIEAVAAPNLAICLDTGHANISKEVDSTAFLRKAGPRVRALHIADNLGAHDDHILPYGRGTVKWPEVMHALREINYNGMFNFEVPGENHCPEPVRLAKLDYALALARWMIERDGI